MRVLIAALIFASVLAAQRGGHGGFRGGGGHGFRGGGGFVHGRGFSGGFVRGHQRGFVGSGFRFNRGFYGGYRGGYSRHFGRGWSGNGIVGFGGWYGAPYWSSPIVYSTPAYAYPYDVGYPAVSIVTVPADPAPSRPAIIINENIRPQARYESPRSPVYLIATTDSVVWAALAYWVEDDVLHFVTSKGERRQIPFSQLDRPLTEQLNRERNVELRLP
jgi:hypothetical protein